MSTCVGILEKSVDILNNGIKKVLNSLRIIVKKNNTENKKSKIITFDSVMVERCCYADYFSNFIKENEEEFLDKIKSTFLKDMF